MPDAVEARITLLPELNTLLLAPKESTPVIFNESLAAGETFTLLLAFKFLMERLVKLLPEMACAVDPANSIVPVVASMLPAVAVVMVPAICIVAPVTVSVAPEPIVIFLTVPVPEDSIGIKATPVLIVTSSVIVGTLGHQFDALPQVVFTPSHVKAGFTVTATVLVEVQPPGAVPVAVYVVVLDGFAYTVVAAVPV